MIFVKNGTKYETTKDGVITAIYGECPPEIVLGVTKIKDISGGAK